MKCAAKHRRFHYFKRRSPPITLKKMISELTMRFLACGIHQESSRVAHGRRKWVNDEMDADFAYMT